MIGDGDPRGPDANRVLEWAEEVGMLLARGGATVVTGGLGGVMQAASKGRRRLDDRVPSRARLNRGERVRPHPDRDRAGVMRNLVVVTSSDAVVAAADVMGAVKLVWRSHGPAGGHARLVADRVRPAHGRPARTARDPREAAQLALRMAKDGPVRPAS